MQALIAACCSHPVAVTLSQLLRNGHLPLPACTVLGVSPVDLTLAGLLALLQRARLDIALLDSMALLAAVWTLGEHATLNSALNSAWVHPQVHSLASMLDALAGAALQAQHCCVIQTLGSVLWVRRREARTHCYRALLLDAFSCIWPSPKHCPVCWPAGMKACAPALFSGTQATATHW